MRILLPLRLVLREIRHEWLSSICLCIAIAAALIPLLMVLGLKDGTVATLRERLASEPQNLEVKIHGSGSLEQSEIDAIAELPEVGFCVPCTRLLATSAKLTKEGGAGSPEETSLIPTAEGDPWLARYGQPVPQPGEMVLSWQIAEKLGISKGDRVKLSSSRRKDGRWQHAEKSLLVVGILPRESNAGPRSCVPLSTVVAVEEFLENARDSLDENAPSSVVLNPVYYGAVVAPANLPESFRAGIWGQDCPFREQAAYADAAAQGEEPAEGLLCREVGQFKSDAQLRRLYSRVRQGGGRLWFWNPPLEATYTLNGESRNCRIEPIPDVAQFPRGEAEMVLYTAEKGLPERLVLHFEAAGRQTALCFTLRHREGVPAGCFRAAASTLGLMYQAGHKGVSWNEELQCLRRSGRTYARIRLYARTLDDVEPLVRLLNERELPASGNIGDIERVRLLDKQLSSIFGLIALIGIAGAGISLALSLFHNTRKRRKNYAVLATLGLSRHSLALFPVWESVLLTLVSVLLALGAFHGMGMAIDCVFAGELAQGESLSRLSWQKHLIILLAAMFAALVAALASACSVLRGQPAAAIRES